MTKLNKIDGYYNQIEKNNIMTKLNKHQDQISI